MKPLGERLAAMLYEDHFPRAEINHRSSAFEVLDQPSSKSHTLTGFTVRHTFIFLTVLTFSQSMTLHAAESDISWVIQYKGKSLPAAPWFPIGIPNAKLADGVRHLSDPSKDDLGAFEAEWIDDLDGKEIIVEARIKPVSMVGHRASATATWPQRDGAPICIQVSDGQHEEGILLTRPQDKHPEAAKGYVRTLTDRFAQADTRDTFHTYRLIIRG